MFLARFNKQDEDNPVSDESEFYINLKNNRNLTESDTDKYDFRSQLERKTQNLETEYGGWRFY